MGHARRSTTRDVYSHELAAARRGDSVASRRTDAFSGILAVSGISQGLKRRAGGCEPSSEEP